MQRDGACSDVTQIRPSRRQAGGWLFALGNSRGKGERSLEGSEDSVYLARKFVDTCLQTS